ncbi:hypothetical protein Micbo1qcDRAFT_202850 [Microdochium bolleyi]|uniref:Uncharacterized protein n=1 Tax=Microdochium bolleyi TaxID=196109 RepID=A0A136J697_9PEZI|nr:hypothetical protein Micbo1qcDRAFT_202850 [Microdochium bolleyi]
MAAFTFTTYTQAPVARGRSGYNKDGEDEEDKFRNSGRSGYNKDGEDEEDKLRNSGRSGYNKDGEDEEDKASPFITASLGVLAV